MEKSKQIMFIIIIVVVIIIMILLSLLLLNLRKNNNGFIIGKDDFGDSPEVMREGIQPVVDSNIFYSISNCIQTYLNNSNINLQLDDEVTLEHVKTSVYNMLNDNYKIKNNITMDNITNYLYNGESYFAFYPLKMNEFSQDNITFYMVYGLIEDNKTGNYVEDAYYIIRLDNTNYTFDIEPLEKGKYNNIDDIGISGETKAIEENGNNKFKISMVKLETLINRYIANYKKMAMSYQDRAYEYLDKTYRDKRFGSLEEYKKYVQENREKIANIKIDKYQITSENSESNANKQYVCIDTEGNYYIFKETAVMQYTLMLDTYTVDIPEFLKKYKEVTPQEKVILNMNKFRQAINDKNYKYAYSILADSFKANNFKTQTDFENYIKTNLFENNEFKYEEFGDEANTYYTYRIKITDGSKKSNNEITKTFIILLENGTDFKLSFNV